MIVQLQSEAIAVHRDCGVWSGGANKAPTNGDKPVLEVDLERQLLDSGHGAAPLLSGSDVDIPVIDMGRDDELVAEDLWCVPVPAPVPVPVPVPTPVLALPLPLALALALVLALPLPLPLALALALVLPLPLALTLPLALARFDAFFQI